MTTPFPEHPLRHAVTAELHVRTFEPLQAPARVLHLAYLTGPAGSGENVAHLQRLLGHFEQSPAEEPGQHYCAHLGGLSGLSLRWERHTEFVTYSFTLSGPFDDPFGSELVESLPADWLAALPGEVVSAALLALESRDQPVLSLPEISRLFDGNTLVGAEVVGGAALAWSDLRIHRDGYNRILLHDLDLSARQTGRLVKRALDINAYRAMALLGLQPARRASVVLSDAEQRLADVAARMAQGNERLTQDRSENQPQERRLLAELAGIAAEIESVAVSNAARFDASRAYYGVVRQRLDELRQKRIPGLQTFTEFLDARLAPGVATCEATGQRQQALAERAARMTALLRARVELQLQEQNRNLLDSMDRRARLQLRLQETVEGLSVVAIGYYGLGLVGYLLKGLEAGGLPLDPTIGIALALPLVLGLAWFGLKRIKKRVLRDTEQQV